MQCSHIYKNGVDVTIVSSGAVACGRHLLSKGNIEEDDIQDRQVEAVFGQPTLIGAWVAAFRKYGVKAGQALITENDEEFLVSADNDRLAAFVATTVKADTVLILTDVEGVLDTNNDLIEDGSLIKDDVPFYQSSEKGTGGMTSKVRVLKELSNQGVKGIIAGAKQQNIILKAARGNTRGISTTFQAH